MAINLEAEKKKLIDYWISSGVLTGRKIISAFRKVKREDFVLPQFRDLAYEDEPLPTMAGQTISQPTTVAIMTQQLGPKAGQKVLEVGTGSGYQAAILSEIVGSRGKIFTFEIINELFDFAKNNLKSYKNVRVIFGNALEEIKKSKIKFDRIIVTAAAKEMPKTLFGQLKENGIMLIPVGSKFEQRLLKIKKIRTRGDTQKASYEKQITDLGPFIFVPLVSAN